MTSLLAPTCAVQAAAAVSALVLARRRPDHLPAAVALVVLAVASLLGALIAAVLSTSGKPSQGWFHAVVYLEAARSFAVYAAVTGLAVSVAVAPERRRRAVGIVGAVWLLASVAVGAAWPSPLVRGEGQHRVLFAADLFGLFVSTVALVTWARAGIAAKRSPSAVHAVAVCLVALDAAILLAPFSPWRGDLFAMPFGGVQLIITMIFATVTVGQVIAWRTSPG